MLADEYEMIKIFLFVVVTEIVGFLDKHYRIAGNFGGSKLWRMVLNLRFGEFNFGAFS